MSTGVVDIVAHLLETLDSDWARHASGRRLQFVVAYVREVLTAAVAIQRSFGHPAPRRDTKHIDDSGASDGTLNRPPQAGPRSTVDGEVFRREGDYWTVRYGGVTVRLKHTTGLFYIAYLLRYPEREVHCIELVNALNTAGPQRRGEGIDVPNLRTSLGDAGEMLDANAVCTYKRRLEDLAIELDEALTLNDLGRVGQARSEIAFLTHELSRAVGMDGRPRRAGSHAERARVNVSRAVAAALDRIRQQHRPLAEHLRCTIRTGTFCAYTPDPRVPLDWQL